MLSYLFRAAVVAGIAYLIHVLTGLSITESAVIYLLINSVVVTVHLNFLIPFVLTKEVLERYKKDAR